MSSRSSGTAWFVMHRLVRHPPLGHPTHFGQIWQWRRCQQPDSQLEPIFYPGARSFKEKHPRFVESPPALNAAYRTARARSLATNTFLRERYLGNLAIAIFGDR